MTPQEIYTTRRDDFARQATDLDRRSALIGNTRLALFLLAGAALMGPTLGLPPGPYLHWTAGAASAIFIALMVVHGRVHRRQRRASEARLVNEEALSRLARDWDAIPEPRLQDHNSSSNARPSFARDLDLFGRASLWKLLSTVSTPLGKQTLARWLLDPDTPEAARERQNAVRELAPRVEFRQELQQRARTMEKLDPDCEPFLRWAEDQPWLPGKPFLRWAARILPLITLPLLGLGLGGILAHRYWMIMALISFILVSASAREIHGIFSRISSREGEFLGYAQALEHLIKLDGQSPLLTRLGDRLTTDGLEAHLQMKRLHSMVTVADARYSGMVHGPLQALFLWDVHALERLESWQLQAGRSARAWLASLGEVEALCALAGLAFDEPEWAFPDLLEFHDSGRTEDLDEQRLSAVALGHPLLASSVRVCNDVTLGPPGSFLLITGSNMSGKSTLIRSVGLNVVLAQAGGPVCAQSMQVPPVEIGSSVLIEDSLESGVSFFMAELHRIKQIVDLSESSRTRGRRLLYLMDEILRGTNSFERQTAVRKVLIHLLRQGSIGAISTHDLNLAEIEELTEACRPVHFRETVENAPGRPVMSFDYLLRPGEE